MNPTEHPGLKVVYIIGCGRSGSTILDNILGTADSALSTGELGHIFWAFHPISTPEAPILGTCSCGLPVTQCPLWSNVWSDLSARYDMGSLERDTRRFEYFSGFIPTLVLGRLFRTRAFREHLDSLGQSVRSVARIGGVRVLIDSSKEPGRGWLYSLLPREDFDVRFIHLVRDGRGVVSSMLRHFSPAMLESGPSPQRPLVAATFATLFWVYLNLCASLVGALNRPRYLLVRYEDLVSNPMETLVSVESFLGENLSEPRRRIAAGEPLSAGHQLCGNRSKFSPFLRVKSREAAKDALPLGPSLVFLSLAGWLQWVYLRARPPRRRFRRQR